MGRSANRRAAAVRPVRALRIKKLRSSHWRRKPWAEGGGRTTGPSALIVSLGHPNPWCAATRRRLGKMGESRTGEAGVEKVARDEDGGAGQAIRPSGAIGGPSPAAAELVVADFQDADTPCPGRAVESWAAGAKPSEAALSGSGAAHGRRDYDQVKVEGSRFCRSWPAAPRRR